MIVVPSALSGRVVANGELEATSGDGAEVGLQEESEGEPVGASVIGAGHVGGADLATRHPVVERVADGHVLLEGDVSDPYRTVDDEAILVDDTVLHLDVRRQHLVQKVDGGAWLRETEHDVRPEVGRCRLGVALEAARDVAELEPTCRRFWHEGRVAAVQEMFDRFQIESERVGEAHGLLPARTHRRAVPRRQRQTALELRRQALTVHSDVITDVIGEVRLLFDAADATDTQQRRLARRKHPQRLRAAVPIVVRTRRACVNGNVLAVSERCRGTFAGRRTDACRSCDRHHRSAVKRRRSRPVGAVARRRASFAHFHRRLDGAADRPYTPPVQLSRPMRHRRALI